MTSSKPEAQPQAPWAAGDRWKEREGARIGEMQRARAPTQAPTSTCTWSLMLTAHYSCFSLVFGGSIHLPPQKGMLWFLHQMVVGCSSKHEGLFENGKTYGMHIQHTTMPACKSAHWTMDPLGTWQLFFFDVSFLLLMMLHLSGSSINSTYS